MAAAAAGGGRRRQAAGAPSLGGRREAVARWGGGGGVSRAGQWNRERETERESLNLNVIQALPLNSEKSRGGKIFPRLIWVAQDSFGATRLPR